MGWFLLLPALVVLICAGVLLPWSSLRLAARNTRREGERRSRSRAERELHHLVRFLGSAVGLPVAGLLLLGGAVFVVHAYVIPQTNLAEVFGAQHPEVALHALDIEAWREAEREAARLEAERRAQGFAPAFSLSAFFWEHWPLHPLLVVLFAGLVYWIVARRFVAAARAYRSGVYERRKEYLVREAERSGAADGAPQGPAPAPTP